MYGGTHEICQTKILRPKFLRPKITPANTYFATFKSCNGNGKGTQAERQAWWGLVDPRSCLNIAGCGLVIVSSKWFKPLFPSPSTSWPENNAMIGCWSACLGFRLIWLGPIWKRGRLLVGRSRGEVGGRPIRSPLPAPHFASCRYVLHVDVLHVDTCYTKMCYM